MVKLKNIFLMCLQLYIIISCYNINCFKSEIEKKQMKVYDEQVYVDVIENDKCGLKSIALQKLATTSQKHHPNYIQTIFKIFKILKNTPCKIDGSIQELRKSLPKSVDNLLNAKQLCIENGKYNKFLVFDKYFVEKNKRWAFLSNKNDDNYVWKVGIHVYDGTIQLQHVYGDQDYLTCDEENVVFGEKCKTKYANWIVEVVDDNIRLKNLQTNLYLSANEYEEVTTSPLKNDNTVWIVNDCRKDI